MRAWPILLAVVTGCTDRPVTGEASSTAHPTARSASVTIANVDLLEPPGTYRRWSVEVVEDPPGTPCGQVGPALVTIDLFTVFSSAPRGVILVSPAGPPVLFPAAFVTVVDGINPEGRVAITAAATTQVVGQLTGFVNQGGAIVTLDVAFDAPSCTP